MSKKFDWGPQPPHLMKRNDEPPPLPKREERPRKKRGGLARLFNSLPQATKVVVIVGTVFGLIFFLAVGGYVAIVVIGMKAASKEPSYKPINLVGMEADMMKHKPTAIKNFTGEYVVIDTEDFEFWQDDPSGKTFQLRGKETAKQSYFSVIGIFDMNNKKNSSLFEAIPRGGKLKTNVRGRIAVIIPDITRSGENYVICLEDCELAGR